MASSEVRKKAEACDARRKITPPQFYEWRKHFPELKILMDNLPILIQEMKAATNWQLWPEDLYDRDGGEEWRVFPFLHTFPATDPSKSTWVGPNAKQCPKTCALMKKLPTIRTALYSRMAPTMRLQPHQGWAALSNHVLRCHIPLVIPEVETSGVWVRKNDSGVQQFHKMNEIVVFDDSQMHSGFNLSKQHRCVLIVDLLRPPSVPEGIATGAMTNKLQGFIDYFKDGGNAGEGAMVFR